MKLGIVRDFSRPQLWGPLSQFLLPLGGKQKANKIQPFFKMT